MVARHALLIVLVAFGHASAQQETAQAEALFRQGRELMAQGKLAEACAAFAQSHKLDPATTTLLNHGACREKLGQIATAWSLFLEAERATRSATDPRGIQFHATALDRATKLERRVSKLTITVAAESRIDRLEILRGDAPVDPGVWDRALPIDGGTYKITARAPGALPWTTEVTIAPEADARTVAIPRLEAAPPAAPPPADPPPADPQAPPPAPEPPPTSEVPVADVADPPSRVVPLVLGAGAVVAFGGAIGLELWARSTYDDAKSEMMDQARRDSLYDSANTKRYVAQGVAIAGLGCAGVAVWLYLRGRNASTAPASALVVSPTGFAIAGTF
jgi:hypothetical protein